MTHLRSSNGSPITIIIIIAPVPVVLALEYPPPRFAPLSLSSSKWVFLMVSIIVSNPTDLTLGVSRPFCESVLFISHEDLKDAKAVDRWLVGGRMLMRSPVSHLLLAHSCLAKLIDDQINSLPMQPPPPSWLVELYVCTYIVGSYSFDLNGEIPCIINTSRHARAITNAST